MAGDDKQDELAARKARNDAIRRARERPNAATDADTASEESADAGDGSGPNYVEFIDRKMREKDKPGG